MNLSVLEEDKRANSQGPGDDQPRRRTHPMFMIICTALSFLLLLILKFHLLEQRGWLHCFLNHNHHRISTFLPWLQILWATRWCIFTPLPLGHQMTRLSVPFFSLSRSRDTVTVAAHANTLFTPTSFLFSFFQEGDRWGKKTDVPSNMVCGQEVPRRWPSLVSWARTTSRERCS